MKKMPFASLVIPILFTACGLFTLPLPEQEREHKAPTIYPAMPDHEDSYALHYGTWRTAESGGAFKELEMKKGSLTERTYINNAVDSEKRYDGKNYLFYAGSYHGNYGQIKCHSVYNGDTYSVSGDTLKIGGGDITYTRVYGLTGELEGKWKWESEDYFITITFAGGRDGTAGSVRLLFDLGANGWNEWIGGYSARGNVLQLGMSFYINNRDNRWFKITDDNILKMARITLTNEEITAYNNSVPAADTVNVEMFGLLWGVDGYVDDIRKLNDNLMETYYKQN